jgi:hypothetical protein
MEESRNVISWGKPTELGEKLLQCHFVHHESYLI